MPQLKIYVNHIFSQETTTNNSSQKRDVISASVSDLEQPDADVKTTLTSWNFGTNLLWRKGGSLT